MNPISGLGHDVPSIWPGNLRLAIPDIGVLPDIGSPTGTDTISGYVSRYRGFLLTRYRDMSHVTRYRVPSAKWAVHILHIGNNVRIFCISCILFCIFCILHAILSDIMKTCIFCIFFCIFFLHILHIDFNCILCIFYILVYILCILFHILFDIFCILISIAYFAYCTC